MPAAEISSLEGICTCANVPRHCARGWQEVPDQRLRGGGQDQKYPIPAGIIEGGTFIETNAEQI